MQTIQYRKSRIWEMKEDKYTKGLANNQVCTIFHIQELIFGKMFNPNYYKALYVDVPLRGTNMAARIQQKNLFLSFPTNA